MSYRMCRNRSGKPRAARRRALVLALVVICAATARADERRPRRNPIVRVVTISADGLTAGSEGGLFDGAMERLNHAGSFEPDVACLPELFARSAAEPVPGPSTRRLGDWARKHSSYVIAGLKTLSGGRTFNSAVLIDRKGKVAGQFDKIHPTEQELEQGISPGATEPRVFDTDFGKIGIQICFDVNWWENWRRLKEKGAQIVFFPAAYPAAQQLSAIALENEFFIVSSTGRSASRIYDITGSVLSTSGNYQHWAGAILPLGRRLYEVDFHVQKLRLIEQKYGTKVEVRWYHDDDWFTLASLDPDLTVTDIEKEFGLTPLRDYRVRAGRAADTARVGQ
ncbi:MAG: carbon-nitrogen hydrolase family protein [Bryobacteraceae bacterium]